jgi:hypothetical protein
MRRTSVALRAALLLSFVAAHAPAATARADVGGLKGKIVISDAEFGTGYGSDAAMVKAVKKQAKTSLAGEGAWTLNLMVFLKEAPGAEKINIVYYDISKRPYEQVNYSEVQVQATQKIIPINGVAVSKDLGFVKGHTYEVRATRLIGGKEKVYAKGTVKLK